MSIKSNFNLETADPGHFAVTAPHPSDIVSGTLRHAFAIMNRQAEQTDFTSLIAQIDRADARRRPGAAN